MYRRKVMVVYALAEVSAFWLDALPVSETSQILSNISKTICDV